MNIYGVVPLKVTKLRFIQVTLAADLVSLALSSVNLFSLTSVSQLASMKLTPDMTMQEGFS